MRRFWTPQDLQALCESYPDNSTKSVAAKLNRSIASTYGMAGKLGLCKSAAYLASDDAYILRSHPEIGAAGRFRPGNVPANKGIKQPGWAPGRMGETQFKPGCRTGAANRNWKPVGTILPDSDGYLRIKVREHWPGEHSGFGNSLVWPFLQRHLWRQIYGPIPAGHAVTFIDGDRTNCNPDNLKLISRRELMARNSVHNLPPELKQVIQLCGALKRKIRRIGAQK